MKKQHFKILGYLLIFSIFVVLKVMGAEELIQTSNIEPTQSWLPIVSLGVSVLGTVLQGAQQRRQARELEKQNIKPDYTLSPQLQKNQAIANQMAKSGLPDEVYNNQLNQIQQNMATGLRQLGARGANPINVNSLVRSANQAVGNLNAQDAQARVAWTQQVMSANQAVANDERYAFQTNQLNPYLMNANNIASMRRAGTQNMFGALGMLGQGAMMGTFDGIVGSKARGSNIGITNFKSGVTFG